MKALQTTQDTELAEFLYLLAKTPKAGWWVTLWGGIRHIENCPIVTVYSVSTPLYGGPNETPLSDRTRLQIMMAADKYRTSTQGEYNPSLRQALLRATGLSEPELKEVA